MKEATIARDDAIRNAEGGADVVFMDAAARAIEYVARRNAEFTTDEVEPICNVSPRESRAWGPVMMKAQTSGIVEPTGTTRLSKNRTCHSRRKMVWRSKVFGQPAPQPTPGAGLFGAEPPTSSYGSI